MVASGTQVRQLQAANAGHNTMLDYLKNLEPSNLQELTATTGPEVLEAMNAFIYRLIGAPVDIRPRLFSTTSRVGPALHGESMRST
jgi:hypothetical protein